MTSEINVTRLDDLSLTRTGDDSVRISWKNRGKILKIAIFSRRPPDEIEHHFTAAGLKENTFTNITGLDPDTCYYFEVISDCGSKTTIGQRRVPLEGSVNFRDLGGYETIDGRSVRWGLVFRSDNLGRLSDRDVAFLEQMGIRQVSSYFTAPKNAIVALIDHIRQTYGSAAGYLRKKAGIEQKVIDQLKMDFLE